MNQTAGAGFATLSENMAARVTFEVLTKVTCRGRSVLELVEEQIAEENRTEERWLIPVAVTGQCRRVRGGGGGGGGRYESSL